MDHILQMKHITKLFPGVRALDDVTLEIERGTVHALMGENGAGKSTLIKVLFGMCHPDSGEIFINGKKVENRSTKETLENGISMIYQELSPMKDLNIAENIFMGRYPTKGKGIVDWKETWKRCQEMFDHWGMPYHPQQSMRTLKMADMQMVEIVKAISFGAKLIIKDEPTRGIDVGAKAEIYSIMQELAEQGIGIILISSDMEEIIGMSNRILVMCEGVMNGELDRSEVTQEKIMELASEVKK
ncbi:sugar ABC transporter ATP-binding protein [Butyricicoccus pullicaecorum]|nr:sugar ABC transporter ATP-binding protein [Butyricicoccus pullicaecorum]